MAVPGIKGDQIEDGTLNQDDIQFKDDATDNATTTKPGLLPKLSGSPTDVLNGVGNWVPNAAMSKPIISSMTFSPANWTLVGSLYQAFVTVTGVTTNHACYAFVDFGSEQNALDAKLSHLVGCTANKVTFYSATLPTGDISLAMHIYDVGGYTKGGVFLPMGPSVPSQTNNAGKFLTTDGTNASWSDVADWKLIPNCNYWTTKQCYFAGDLRPVLTVGMRVKIINETTKYGIISKITYNGSTRTTIELLISSSTLLTNSYPLTFYFSTAKIPYGFDVNTNGFRAWYSNGTYSGPNAVNANTWHSGGYSLIVPAGLWDVYYKAFVSVDSQLTNWHQAIGVLANSTTPNETNFKINTQSAISINTAGVSGAGGVLEARSRIFLTSAETLYFLVKPDANANIYYINDAVPLYIEAVSAYL